MKLLMKTNLFNRLIVGKPLGVGLENLLFFTYISFNDLTLVQLNSVCHTLKDSIGGIYLGVTRVACGPF